MKYLIQSLFLATLAFSTVNLNAQNEYVTQEDVDFLFDYIDQCKADMAKIQEKIDGWAAAGVYPVEEYNRVEAELKEKEECVKRLRKVISEWRKKWPQYFSDAQEVAVPYGRKGEHITGNDFQRLVDSVAETLKRLKKVFNGLAKPK